MNQDKPSLDVDNSQAHSARTPQPSDSPANAPAPLTPENRRMWHLVLPTCFLLAVVMLLANVLPLVLVHWRRAEAQADADAIYFKRRAELKAEEGIAGNELDM